MSIDPLESIVGTVRMKAEEVRESQYVPLNSISPPVTAVIVPETEHPSIICRVPGDVPPQFRSDGLDPLSLFIARMQTARYGCDPMAYLDHPENRGNNTGYHR